MKSLTKEQRLKKIRRKAVKIPAFDREDMQSFIKLAADCMCGDFYKIAPVINKAELFKIYTEVVENAKLKMEHIVTWPPYFHLPTSIFNNTEYQTFYQTGVPLWAVIWHHVWKDELSIFVPELDKTVFKDIYSSTRGRVTSYLEWNVLDDFYGEGNAFPVQMYNLFSVQPKFLMHNKFLKNKKGLEGIHALNALFDKGYGVPFVLFQRGKVRLEIRLLVRNPESAPAIVDCKELPFLEVSIPQNGLFAPEALWRFPDRLTIKDILVEVDAEIRHRMLETMDNEVLLKQCDTTLVDETENEKLYKLVLDKDTALGLVYCACPTTGKKHVLRVPPDFRTVKEAIAWTFYEPPASYAPFKET